MSIVRDILVRITADNSGLEKGLEAAKGGLKRFSVAAAAALGAATGAFTALTIASVNSAQQIERFAKLSNSSTQEFQRWAAAVSTVGFEQEKLADVFKDVNDRIGDFISTGAGPMADFFEKVAPKVGVTAEQFRKLSGPQALQLYVDTLQKAGANQQDMTFYLEAMAGDAAALIPLLRNNGAELNRLADAASRAGAILSDETLAQLAAAKKSVDEIQVSFTGFTNQLVAAVAPALQTASASLNTMMEVGGPVSQAIDRIAASFGALASKMASPEFINAATTALTGFIDLASAGADALIWLTENTETLTYALGAAAIALAALGGPLTWIAGLTAAAVAGLISMSGSLSSTGVAANTAASMQKRINQALSDYATAHGPNARAEAKSQIQSLKKEAEAALITAETYAALNEARAQEAASSLDVKGQGLLDQSAGGFDGMQDQFDGTFDEQAAKWQKEADDRRKTLEDLRSDLALIDAVAGGPGALSEPVSLDDPPGLDPFTPDAEGGSGGKSLEDDLKDRLKILQSGLQTESDWLAEWYDDGLKTLDDALSAKMLTEEQYRAEREKLEQEHADRMRLIDERAMDAKLENARIILGGLADLMGTNSKKLFKIGQMAAVAQAMIDGWAAATAAWKWGMAAGGPPLAAAFTAASLAKTAAMISSIRSQSPSGSGSGSSMSGGGSGTSTATTAPAAPLEVRLSGDGSSIGWGDMGTLLKKLNEEAGDRGYRILVAP